MRRATTAAMLTAGLLTGAAGGYWYARLPSLAPMAAGATEAQAPDHAALYYRDPMGLPFWSAGPKKDTSGRDFLAVYEDDKASFNPSEKKQSTTAGRGRILYYRNPMGLPDTSPVPKKDNMGMDYIAVYEGEDASDGKTVKVSLDKIQRSGVRTEKVEERSVIQPVRAVGTVKYDERRLTVVTLRADGYIEDLFVNATGETVKKGDPLFRLYSPEIQTAQSDLIVSAGVRPGLSPGIGYQGTVQRLRNLGVPEERIEEVRTSGKNLRTLDWPSPATGTVIFKGVVNGQKAVAGAELYRIADLSEMWVIAEVPEAELADIQIGTPATVTVRAYPAAPVAGRVAFIYPDIKPETRTARVRIEVPNLVERLKIDMYADVVFQPSALDGPKIAVPASAVIDSGTRQVVLVAKGEGHFEPRPVKLGRRGDGYVEIISGVEKGEEVVTAATFLIDAESNLKAALQAFTQGEAPQ